MNSSREGLNIQKDEVWWKYHRAGKAWGEGKLDPAVHLLHFDRFLKSWKPGVHMTRDSLYFGRVLLDGGEPADLPRAEKVIQAVLDTQVKREGSPAQGNFPWGAEDREEEIWDPNWACFHAQTLLEILHWHGSRINPGLKQGAEAALELCGRHDLKRWVSPAYTNIGLLTSLCLACGGDWLQDPALSQAGRDKLKEVLECVEACGALDEYNSPTYAAVNLHTLGSLLLFLKDEESLVRAEKIWRMQWRSLLVKLHLPSGQLAGPYGRAYGRDMLRHTHAQVKFCLARSLGKGWPIGVEADGSTNDLFPALLVNDPLCPPGLVREFESLALPRLETEVVDSAVPEGILPLRRHPAFWRARRDRKAWAALIANKGRAAAAGFPGQLQQTSTWLDRDFCLGTVNAECMGDQSVPLIAHWPLPGHQDRANYLAALVLKKDDDKLQNLGGGVLCLAQDKGRVLGLMRFELEEAWPGDERLPPSAKEAALGFHFNMEATPALAAGGPEFDLRSFRQGLVFRSHGILIGLRLLEAQIPGARLSVDSGKGSAPHAHPEGEWFLHLGIQPLQVKLGDHAWAAFALEIVPEGEATPEVLLEALKKAAVLPSDGSIRLEWGPEFSLQTTMRLLENRSWMEPAGAVHLEIPKGL
jgi:hypothetical protein